MKNFSKINPFQVSTEDHAYSELWRKRLKKKPLKIYSFGSSMLPLFKGKEMLLVTAAEDIRRGDVVCYRDGSIFVFHRVVQIKNGTVVTKGDNNLYLDKPISASQILGKIPIRGNSAAVSVEKINHILASHSIIQARIYSVLTNNPLARTYCRVMEKYLKTPYLSLAYKQLSKLFIYPIYLFSNKNIGTKFNFRTELTDGSVLLRPFRIKDAREHFLGQDKALIRWLTNKKSTLEEIKDWIRKNQKYWENNGPIFNFAIVDTKKNKLVGMVEANFNYKTLEVLREREGEVNISYGLYPFARGKGYASRAVNLIVAFLKDKGFSRATITVRPENKNSLKVPLRCGFKENGVIIKKNKDKLNLFIKNLN